LALLHGASAHAPTVPNDALVEMILARLKQSLNVTDIRKKIVCNTMGKAEDTALIAALGWTRDIADMLPDYMCTRHFLRWAFKVMHPQGIGLTRAEQAEVDSYLKECEPNIVWRYSPSSSSGP